MDGNNYYPEQEMPYGHSPMKGEYYPGLGDGARGGGGVGAMGKSGYNYYPRKCPGTVCPGCNTNIGRCAPGIFTITGEGRGCYNLTQKDYYTTTVNQIHRMPYLILSVIALAFAICEIGLGVAVWTFFTPYQTLPGAWWGAVALGIGGILGIVAVEGNLCEKGFVLATCIISGIGIGTATAGFIIDTVHYFYISKYTACVTTNSDGTALTGTYGTGSDVVGAATCAAFANVDTSACFCTTSAGSCGKFIQTTGSTNCLLVLQRYPSLVASSISFNVLCTVMCVILFVYSIVILTELPEEAEDSETKGTPLGGQVALVPAVAGGTPTSVMLLPPGAVLPPGLVLPPGMVVVTQQPPVATGGQLAPGTALPAGMVLAPQQPQGGGVPVALPPGFALPPGMVLAPQQPGGSTVVLMPAGATSGTIAVGPAPSGSAPAAAPAATPTPVVTAPSSAMPTVSVSPQPPKTVSSTSGNPPTYQM